MKPVIGITCSTGEPPAGSAIWRHVINADYVDWIERAGGLPLVLPNVGPKLAVGMVDLLDGLLLTGGEDLQPLLYGAEPEPHLGVVDVPRDRFELPLAQVALRRTIPIFGICRGLQTLNVAAGGTLRQDLAQDPTATVQHRARTVGGASNHHQLTIDGHSRLFELVGVTSVAVNSYHHQAIDRVADGYLVTARTADQVIEAIELPGERFVLGVQWHPELMEYAPTTRALFKGFVAAAAETIEEWG